MVTDFVRTPDERFAGLPDFPWELRYLEWGGMRLARVDEGEGAGRRPLPRRADVVVPVAGDGAAARGRLPRDRAGDLAGFGRSDKPIDIDWYSYDRHTSMIAALLEDLDLQDATIVVHDWGGPIGLRLAVEHQERIKRIVILDTGLFTGHQKMTDAWLAFRDFVGTEDLRWASSCAAPARTIPARR